MGICDRVAAQVFLLAIEEQEREIQMEDFLLVISQTNRSVSESYLKKYEEFGGA